MIYLVAKALISGVLIAVASQLARRFPGFGALIASLPLVSVLGMIWLWRDKPDAENMAAHAQATFCRPCPCSWSFRRCCAAERRSGARSPQAAP